MILNDRYIRSLSLVPTHQRFEQHEGKRYLYTCIGDTLYSADTGHSYEWAKLSEQFLSGLDRLSPEQQRGYAPGCGPVPTEGAFGFEEHQPWGRMIYPFEPTQVRTRQVCVDVTAGEPHPDGTRSLNIDTKEERIISYGTSSMGYDVRLGRKFKVFTNVYSAVIDPLDMPDNAYVDVEGDFVMIPPNSYVLGHTIEYFRMPEDVVAICVGKSTYARVGCAINVTPIEPGFEGQVVIEIANQTSLPMKVYADMGIAQFMFLKGDPCEISYAKRAGKYQGQLGLTTARV